MGIFNTSTARQTDHEYSTLEIHSRVAKEFGDSETISQWTRELNDEMAVGCYNVVKALNAKKKESGGRNLSWNDVVRVFRRCNSVYEDNVKKIEGRRSWDEMNYFKFDGSPDVVRKRQIMAWLRKLFNEQDEQSIVDNSVIFNDGVISKLADIASQSGVTVKDPATFFAADEEKRKKVKEIGLIRFPIKYHSKIKLYYVAIYSWFKCSRVLFVQHDQNGIEIDCDVCEFKVNTDSIDKSRERKARENMASDPNIFDF